jgi:hypothetical protein
MTTKTKNKTVIIQVRLQRINLLSFYEHDYSSYGLTAEDIKSYRLEYGVGLKIDKDEENIAILVNIKCCINKDNQGSIELFGIKTEHIFKFPGFKDDFSSSPEGDVKIPDNLMKDLLGIALNDTRGMLHVQINNPAYKTKILLLVDTSDLLKGLQKEEKKKQQKRKK